MTAYLFSKDEIAYFAKEYGVSAADELCGDAGEAVGTLLAKGIVKRTAEGYVIDKLVSFLFKKMISAKRYERCTIEGSVYCYQCDELIIALLNDIRKNDSVCVIPFKNEKELDEWLAEIG